MTDKQDTVEERIRWAAGVIHVCAAIELEIQVALAKAKGRDS